MQPVKSIITQQNRNIVQDLHKIGDILCRNKINTKQYLTKIKQFKRGFIYRDRFAYDILGVALFKVSNDNKIINLLLLCTKENNIRLGETIFNDIEEYARINMIGKIITEPAVMAEGFYTKMGMKPINSNNAPQNTWSKTVNTRRNTRKNNTRQNIKTRRNSNNMNTSQ